MADHIDSISTESESGLYCAQREPFCVHSIDISDEEWQIDSGGIASPKVDDDWAQ